MAKPKFRVTYATLSADNEDLHAAYEEGVRTARGWLGASVPAYVDGEAAGGDRVAYFILLELQEGRVTAIRDFRYVPYIAAEADFSILGG